MSFRIDQAQANFNLFLLKAQTDESLADELFDAICEQEGINPEDPHAGEIVQQLVSKEAAKNMTDQHDYDELSSKCSKIAMLAIQILAKRAEKSENKDKASSLEKKESMSG